MTNVARRLCFKKVKEGREPLIEWHDLRIAPYDLPEDHEQVLTTTENYEGTRRIRTDIFLKSTDDYHYFWCAYEINPITGLYEEDVSWEEVVAWAYLPTPYMIEREKI